jgi:hypothetical protein
MFVAALAMAGSILVGCSTALPQTADSVPIGGGTMAGVEWSARAARVTAEELYLDTGPQAWVCVRLTIDSDDEVNGICASAVNPPDPVLSAGLSGATRPDASGPMMATGIVRGDVAAVELELIGGERVAAQLSSLEPLGLAAAAFAAALPAGSPVAAFIALDERGNELGRAVGPGES